MTEDKNDVRLQAQSPLSSTEARQGRFGRPVFYVLACSLVLAAIGWAVAEIWAESADQDTQEPTVATVPQTESNPPSGPRTFDDNPARGPSKPPETEDRDPTYQSGTGGASQQVTPDGSEK